VNAAAESDAAPVNVQYSAGPWRVVNNELGPWQSSIEAKAAGVSGHGNGNTILDNGIHDIASATGNENHGICADSGASNWNIGFNRIHDIDRGNLIQFFDNVGLAGQNYVGLPTGWQGFTGMNVFNNWLDTSGKYGLNLADGTISGAIWNNVITGSTYSGLRIHDNIFAAGPHMVSTSSFYENVGSTDAYLDLEHNLYCDYGYGWAHVTGNSGDPQFTLFSRNWRRAHAADCGRLAMVRPRRTGLSVSSLRRLLSEPIPDAVENGCLTAPARPASDGSNSNPSEHRADDVENRRGDDGAERDSALAPRIVWSVSGLSSTKMPGVTRSSRCRSVLSSMTASDGGARECRLTTYFGSRVDRPLRHGARKYMSSRTALGRASA